MAVKAPKTPPQHKTPAAPAPKPPPAPPVQKSAYPAKTPGFLDRLVALFGSDDPERQKQRQLRDIASELRRNRGHFYNPAKSVVEPGLGRFFWEIYKAVAAAQVLLKGAEVSGALKMAMLDLSLTEEQTTLKERLSEKSISERAKKGADPATLEAEVKRDIKTLGESIDPNWINEIDALFNRTLVFLDLVGFDYYFLLKKLDPAMPERDFSYSPHFESTDGASIKEELQDFLEILPTVDADADWDRILNMLKEHRGIEIISRDALRKALQNIREAQKNGIMILVVRHIIQNPGWKPMVRTHRERIVEPYLTKIKAEAETTAQKVAHGKRSEKMEELARAVFGSGAVQKLAHYSENSNPEYAQKMLGGFTYVTALNYLRAFLVDYLSKSIREVVDLLIIKGKWSDNQPSQQMSEAFHQLLMMAEKIGRFDTDLAEDGELGRRLKTIALKADRDKKALVQLRMVLQQVNEEARTMVGDSIQFFISIARVLKLAHEDIGKPNPAYLTNWKELKPASDKDLRVLIAAVYKKIYNFVQLLQMYK
jgi:hypothetical protein